jgi:hypothetical protein
MPVQARHNAEYSKGMLHAREGEMLKETPKNEGTKNQLTGRGTIGGSSEEPPIVPPTLSSIGITKKQSSRAQKLADIDAIIQERKDAANMAERARPLSTQGRPEKIKGCNATFKVAVMPNISLPASRATIPTS